LAPSCAGGEVARGFAKRRRWWFWRSHVDTAQGK